MKRILLVSLLAVLLSAPLLTLAQDVVYVNTDAPGVHKEYDKKYGGYVWKNGMGSFICRDKEMKSIWEMDKNVYFTGSNNDPDNPEVSPFSGIKKVWDKKRGCYVWKNVYTGDFLGTDKASVQKEEKKKAKELADKKKKEEQAAKKQQKEKEKAEKKQQQKKETPEEAIQKSEKMLITSDEQLREAEAALKEAKAMYAQAKAEGIDLSEYNIDAYIKQAEDAINEYKRARNKMK
ncbi:MAG: hypothetical protein J6P83_02460 [Bacteroidales bacterium]|nr:hypothetical protein [Bacteroidales bacterium]